MGGADDGVATNTDSGGETNVGQFVHQLVGQGTGLGNQTNLALAGDVRRDNTNQALLGGDDAGAVGANDTGDLLAVLVHGCLRSCPELCGVLNRNALGDDDDEADLSLDSLENCCLGEGRGNEDDGDVRAGLLHSLSYGTEDVQLDVGAVLRLVGDGGTSLASVHAAHNVGACCEHACGVLGTLATGDALNDDLGVLVHKDRHITSLKSFAGDYAL